MHQSVCLAALASGMESAIPSLRLTGLAHQLGRQGQYRPDEEGLAEKVQTQPGPHCVAVGREADIGPNP